MGLTALGVAAAGCGSSSSSSSGSGGGETNLSFWNESTGLDLKDFCIAGTNFSKSRQNTTVSCTGFTDISKVDAASAAGNPPDLVQTWDWPELPTLFEEGAIVSLSPYMKRDHFDTASVLPGVLPAGQSVSGEYFALPFMSYCQTDFFWNKKLFAKKGLDPDTPPKTLEELRTIGEHFDEYSGGKLVRVGFNPVNDPSNANSVPTEAWCFAFGASFYDNSKKEITPTDPGVIRGLEWLQGYADKYGSAQLTRLATGYGESESAQNPFLSEQVAMIGFWDAMVAYRQRYAPNIEMGFSPFPYPSAMPEQRGWGELSFNMCFIPKGASNVEAAWDLLSFIESDVPSNIAIAKSLANTPQNVHAIKSPKNDVVPILKEVQNYVAGPKQRTFPPAIPVATQYATEWAQQTALIFAGKVSIEKGMDRILNSVQPALEKALKGGG